MAGVGVPVKPQSLNLRRVHRLASVRLHVNLPKASGGLVFLVFGDASAKGVIVDVASPCVSDFAVAAALAVVALAEQVARRVVGEVFDVVDEAEDFGEAVEGGVGVAILIFAAVGEQAQVAVGVAVCITLVPSFILCCGWGHQA